MSYVDQKMSGNRITSLIIVAILHVVVGYALVTGLAYDAVRKAVQKVTTIDIKEEVKKEPPPPPKKLDLPPPPPIVVPPPKVNVSVVPPPVTTVATPPPPAPPPPPVLAPPAAPPPPRFTPKKPVPKGRPQDWITTEDYPSRALNDKREGRAAYRVTVGTNGRVVDCQITSSSGHADLDEATCKYVRSRGRFTAGTDGEGLATTDTYSGAVSWKMPKD